jgi:hypothetical protein
MYARTMKTLVMTSLLTIVIGSVTMAQSATIARPHGGWNQNLITVDLTFDDLETDGRIRIGMDGMHTHTGMDIQESTQARRGRPDPNPTRGRNPPTDPCRDPRLDRDEPFLVYVGDFKTFTPLTVVHVGTVPPTGNLPIAVPLHAVQVQGLGLFVATRATLYRINPVLKDGDGVVISCPKGPFFGHYGPVPVGPEIVVTVDADRGVRVRTAADADDGRVGPTMIQATTPTGDPAKRDDDGDVISCPKGPFLTDYGPVAEGPGDVVTTDPGRRVRTAADADGARVGPTMIQ